MTHYRPDAVRRKEEPPHLNSIKSPALVLVPHTAGFFPTCVTLSSPEEEALPPPLLPLPLRGSTAVAVAESPVSGTDVSGDAASAAAFRLLRLAASAFLSAWVVDTEQPQERQDQVRLRPYSTAVNPFAIFPVCENLR